MNISVKRVYDAVSRSDGTRVLVDRLWPRGISKDRARITLWLKDAAPSNELRTWFHEDPDARFQVFQQKYRAELRARGAGLKTRFKALKRPVTLVTAVKTLDRSHIPVLRSFLKRL